jgi:hypothetical protein
VFLMGCMKVKTIEQLPGVPEGLVTKEQLPGVPDGLYEGEEQLSP